MIIIARESGYRRRADGRLPLPAFRFLRGRSRSRHRAFRRLDAGAASEPPADSLPSSRFAPFIERHPERTLARLREPGSRSGPACPSPRLAGFPSSSALGRSSHATSRKTHRRFWSSEILKDDELEYVRRSVANIFNHIGKLSRRSSFRSLCLVNKNRWDDRAALVRHCAPLAGLNRAPGALQARATASGRK